MSRSLRILNPDGSVNRVEPVTARLIDDLYHRLLSLTWARLIGAFAIIYLAANALFALAYLVGGDCLENARHGSFADAFFFSVQTMGTIGYGKMVPKTLYANLLMTLEVLFGLIAFALVTGLFFTKFARPTARVLFSRVAVISIRDQRPAFLFRMANERSNRIVEAQLRVVLLRTETLADGEVMRRLYDLPLRRSASPMFALTWTAVHDIDAQSPLYGETPESLKAVDASIIVSLTGIDETFSAMVHARYVYSAADLVWGGRFADVLVTLPDGERAIDRTRFHEVIALPEALRSPTESQPSSV